MDTVQVGGDGPLVSQVLVGAALGLRWAIARRVVEAAGFAVIPAGERKWYMTARDWEVLRRRIGLDRPRRRKAGAA